MVLSLQKFEDLGMWIGVREIHRSLDGWFAFMTDDSVWCPRLRSLNQVIFKIWTKKDYNFPKCEYREYQLHGNEPKEIIKPNQNESWRIFRIFNVSVCIITIRSIAFWSIRYMYINLEHNLNAQLNLKLSVATVILQEHSKNDSQDM